MKSFISYLSLSSAAAIRNLLVCKIFHSSLQLHIFKVHSHKIHINQKKKEIGTCHTNRVINVKISSNGIYCYHVTPGMLIERNIFHCTASEHKKTNIRVDGHSIKQLAVFSRMSVSGNNTKTEKPSRLQKRETRNRTALAFMGEKSGAYGHQVCNILSGSSGKETQI